MLSNAMWCWAWLIVRQTVAKASRFDNCEIDKSLTRKITQKHIELDESGEVCHQHHGIALLIWNQCDRLCNITPVWFPMEVQNRMIGRVILMDVTAIDTSNVKTGRSICCLKCNYTLRHASDKFPANVMFNMWVNVLRFLRAWMFTFWIITGICPPFLKYSV